jgi:hypothetical protein
MFPHSVLELIRPETPWLYTKGTSDYWCGDSKPALPRHDKYFVIVGLVTGSPPPNRKPTISHHDLLVPRTSAHGSRPTNSNGDSGSGNKTFILPDSQLLSIFVQGNHQIFPSHCLSHSPEHVPMHFPTHAPWSSNAGRLCCRALSR